MRSLKIRFSTRRIHIFPTRQQPGGEQTRIFPKILLCRDSDGQALIEATVVVVLVSVMSLVLIQPALTLMVRMVAGYATGCLARASATDSSIFTNTQEVYETYVKHKLEVLPGGSYFYDSQSVKVEVTSGDQNGFYQAKVSLLQKPLPFVGKFMAQSDGLIHIEERTSLYKSSAFSDASYKDTELILGGQ